MGEYSYKPIMEGWVWSYSRLNSFDDCPYKFFMHYIDDEQEQDMFYASYGSFMHEMLADYYSGKCSKDELPSRFLYSFSDKVKGNRPSDAITKSYIEKGFQYFNNFVPLDIGVLGVEQEAHFNIGGFPIVGIIDLIGEKNGEIYVIDHKSRDLKQKSNRKTPTQNDIEIDAMMRQLYVYSKYIIDEFNKPPRYLCLNCFRSREVISTEFNTEKYNQTMEWVVKTINEIMEQDDFYPKVDFFKCKYLCGLNDRCEYFKLNK